MPTATLQRPPIIRYMRLTALILTTMVLILNTVLLLLSSLRGNPLPMPFTVMTIVLSIIFAVNVTLNAVHLRRHDTRYSVGVDDTGVNIRYGRWRHQYRWDTLRSVRLVEVAAGHILWPSRRLWYLILDSTDDDPIDLPKVHRRATAKVLGQTGLPTRSRTAAFPVNELAGLTSPADAASAMTHLIRLNQPGASLLQIVLWHPAASTPQAPVPGR